MPDDVVKPAAEDTKPHYHSHALSRGLETIRAVAAGDDPVTLTRLHEVTGYPKSTLVRLLSVLEEQDYLIKVDERPSYRLGHGLLPIALSYFRSFSGADLLRPHLADLAKRTGWTANIGTLEGTRVLHLCVEFPDRPIHYTSSEGSFHEAYCTGLGKAILSCLSAQDLLKSLPPEPFDRLTKHTIVTVDDMRADLERTRERGYAIDAEEADIGLRCLAVPLVDNGDLLGALSVSGPSGEGSLDREEDIVAALEETRSRLLQVSDLRNVLGLIGSTVRN